MIKQISVFVENTTGSVFKITEILKNNDIDIRAIAAFDGPSYSILRMIVDDAEKAAEALKEKKYLATVSTVLAVELEDAPGALNNMLGLIKDADIELNYIYSFVIGTSNLPWMILQVSDMKRAEDILKDNKFHII